MSTLPPLEKRELELARPVTASAPDERFINGQLVRQRKIITENCGSFGPTNAFDWKAEHEDWDLGDPIGFGSTEAAAVADLLAQVED